MFGPAFRADLADGFVDDALDFFGVSISVACPNVLNGALKHAEADRQCRREEAGCQGAE